MLSESNNIWVKSITFLIDKCLSYVSMNDLNLCKISSGHSTAVLQYFGPAMQLVLITDQK